MVIIGHLFFIITTGHKETGKTKPPEAILFGGRWGIRTLDPLGVNEML